MDTKGGVRAITALHGKLIAKNSTPLVVDISHDVSVCACSLVPMPASLTLCACVSIAAYSHAVEPLKGHLCIKDTSLHPKYTLYEGTTVYRTLHQVPKVSTIEGFHCT